MEGELKAQEKELSDDITNLNKKVCAHLSCGICGINQFSSQNTSRNNSMTHKPNYEILCV